MPNFVGAALFGTLVLCSAPASADIIVNGKWPDAEALSHIAGERITFSSSSPFTISDIGNPERSPPTEAVGTLFLPPHASAVDPVPAVVMLHGAGGVRSAREFVYGRQFAAMGIAALSVDAFASRSERALGFTDRLLEITETMLMADAYAGLRHLATIPEIDAGRVALIGFSYGGMATMFATYAQVAEGLAPNGLRFVAHVAFYAPCVARFEDNRTTGAPLLMLIGAEDEIVDQERCAEIAADMEAGGSRVEMVVYENAYHQWDGGWSGPRRVGMNLAGCSLRVQRNGIVRDNRTYLPMSNPLTRRAILALCVDRDGYLIGRDDSIRARSNRDLASFLAKAFGI